MFKLQREVIGYRSYHGYENLFASTSSHYHLSLSLYYLHCTAGQNISSGFRFRLWAGLDFSRALIIGTLTFKSVSLLGSCGADKEFKNSIG